MEYGSCTQGICDEEDDENMMSDDEDDDENMMLDEDEMDEEM